MTNDQLQGCNMPDLLAQVYGQKVYPQVNPPSPVLNIISAAPPTAPTPAPATPLPPAQVIAPDLGGNAFAGFFGG